MRIAVTYYMQLLQQYIWSVCERCKYIIIKMKLKLWMASMMLGHEFKQKYLYISAK